MMTDCKIIHINFLTRKPMPGGTNVSNITVDSDRLARIRASLARINKLMDELRDIAAQDRRSGMYVPPAS